MTRIERGTWQATLRRLTGALALGLTMAHAGAAGLDSLLPTSDACDPSKASCIKTCSALDEALGRCKPGGPAPADPAPGDGGGGTCTPGPGGPPSCSGSGPAAKSSTAPSSGAGNPINLISGNKFQEETDLAAMPGVLGLELKRYYNSMSTHPGLIGANWRMSYETVLFDFGSQIQIVQADGRRLMFQRGVGGHATLCTASNVQDGQVRIEESSDGKGPRTYHWRWPDGRTLTFSSGSGGGYPLQAITAPDGKRLVLSYSPSGELMQVRDPQGRKLTFIYASGADKRSRALRAIDTPDGRIAYTQDALGRLVEVSSSKDAQSAPYRTKVYHYEDRYNGGHKTALTGISLRGIDPATGKPAEQRLSTYAYNQAGQAILSTKGIPREVRDGKIASGTGIEQIDVAYVEKSLPYEGKADKVTGEVKPKQLGRTVLTNSLGQKTTLVHAVIGGSYRLVEMRGAGCSTCGTSDMRYAYDASGQLVRSTRLDAAGRPLSSELSTHDEYGRLSRIGIQVHGADGKPGPVQWIRRYEYADVRFKDGSVAVAPLPSLIAEPSVVKGAEHVTRFAYNDRWQVTQETETGFAPAPDAKSATALERTTRYAYTLQGGRSLLTRIDGPLPNGPLGEPADSDVTLMHYDAQGELAQIVEPGGTSTRIVERDAAGRPAQVVIDDGSRVVRSDIRYAADGRRERLDETGWVRTAAGGLDPESRLQRSTRYEYDLLGRLVAIHRPDGTSVKTEFDLAGHPVRLVAPDGSQVLVQRDTESRLVEAERDADASHPLQHLRFDYDAQAGARLVALRDDLGPIAEFSYAEAATALARPSEVRLPMGRTTRYGYDAWGFVREQVLAAGTPERLVRNYGLDVHGRVTSVEARGAGVERRQLAAYDDFGRKLAFASPEHGVSRYVWDQADRLVARVDESGHVSRFSYDAAGRLLASGVDAQPALSRYRYDGRLRIEEIDTVDGERAHSKEVRQLRHDAFGRVLHEEHWVVASHDARDASGVALGVVTRTTMRYDASNGHLVEKITIDHQGREHRLGYEWDAASGQLAAMTFNGQRVVGGIKGTLLGGVTDMTWASGVSEHAERDARGRMAAKTLTAGSQAAPVLRMAWRYDDADRLAHADGPEGSRDFGHDHRDRLVSQVGGAREARFSYDALNNRLAMSTATEDQKYLYQWGRLVAVDSNTENAGYMQAYLPTGLPAWRHGIRSTAAQGGSATLHDTAGRPLAVGAAHGNVRSEYRWGLHGERIARIVAGKTQWYHYDAPADGEQGDALLAAEGTDNGAIVTHYLYVQGRPVARVDTPQAEGAMARSWYQVRKSVMSWFGASPRAEAAVYAIHTDQRAAAVAMTDARGSLVWQADYDAFGHAVVRQASVELNLRLPGQYADAETGLHYNGHRLYDPSTGRYLTPDPVAANPWLALDRTAALAGDNAYAYVSGNPMNQVDPQGLYESDVHYYMTYFLAIVAGMGAEDARMMALATQYVDNNPLTSPVDETHGTLGVVMSIFDNAEQLKKYHFTLAGSDGRTLSAYKNDNLHVGDSPQLAALHSYAIPTKDGECPMPNNQSLQFMGEYLHAFEDTFSHRDPYNKPVDPVWHVLGMEWGVGHGLYGHAPDFTYDDYHCTTGEVEVCSGWNVREGRTYAMEQDTYGRITDYITKMNYVHFKERLGKVTSFSDPDLQKALKDFNAYPASEHGGDMSKKISILNDALIKLGYDQRMEWSPDMSGAGGNGYDVGKAAENRATNFEGLKNEDFPAAMITPKPKK